MSSPSSTKSASTSINSASWRWFNHTKETIYKPYFDLFTHTSWERFNLKLEWRKKWEKHRRKVFYFAIEEESKQWRRRTEIHLAIVHTWETFEVHKKSCKPKISEVREGVKTLVDLIWSVWLELKPWRSWLDFD